MKAVILAGGLGTRLRPLTDTIPKPMLPVKGKPMLEHCIERLVKSGFDELYLALHYLPEKIMDYFGDGSNFGCRITYNIEKEPLGTGGAIKQFKGYLDSTFLVYNSDVFSEIDLSRFISRHNANTSTGVLATIALVSVPNPSQFGVVKTHNDLITEFIEKNPNPEGNIVNAGIYLFEPKVLDYLPEGFCMVERTAFPQLAKESKLGFYKLRDGKFWSDIGTFEAYDAIK